jgi:hypothetical protein
VPDCNIRSPNMEDMVVIINVLGIFTSNVYTSLCLVPKFGKNKLH